MHDHPIPQDVTGYRFHIVGNMTLGQFGQLFLAVLICFGIYSTNLYPIIKWPLIVLVFGVGAMSAFVPIYERPITHWVSTFFSILNKPTQFFWRREPQIPDFFTFISASAQKVVLPELDLTPLRRQKIHEYIVSAKIAAAPDEETQQVQSYVDYVTTLFDTSPGTAAPTPTVQEKVAQKPKLKTRLRSLRPQEDVVEASPSMLIETPVEPVADAQAAEPVVPENAAEPTVLQPFITSASISAQAAAQAQGVDVPEAGGVDMDATQQTTTTEQSAAEEMPTLQTPAMQQAPAEPPPQVSTQATFNAQLPFPGKPTVPNKLVGMVLSNTNELIDGAIVEIHTQDGSVARAVRTNALGQFFVSTPLDKGTYVISVEKAGRQFEPITIELKGKIVEPLEIRSL